MRTFSGLLTALLIAVAGAAYAGDVKYASPEAAFEQGLGAYKAGYYEIAVPALEEAAAKGSELNRFFAEFYLARIYSDNAGAFTNHAKAYLLFHKLGFENAHIDPEDGRRAPFVAKSLIALADYLQRGVKEAGVRADPERAFELLQHAATVFGDREARFELAKYFLSGSSEDVKRGMHFLSKLSEEGYPSAQALLADLFWRGKHVKKDERQALALITMAVENAPEHERIWIENTYQNIYCGSTQGTRKQADGIVATWRKFFARPAPQPPASRTELGELQPQRTCGNGETVDIKRYEPAAGKERPPAATPPAPETMRGGAASLLGLRDAGTTK
jgi:uncharacterized protein